MYPCPRMSFSQVLDVAVPSSHRWYERRHEVAGAAAQMPWRIVSLTMLQQLRAVSVTCYFEAQLAFAVWHSRHPLAWI